MKSYLFLILLIPTFSFAQSQSDTVIVVNDLLVYSYSDASCYASCDGQLQVSVFGPNTPYRFIIGASNDTIVNGAILDTLCPSNYSILVLNGGNNLVDVYDVEINAPSELLIYSNLIKNPTCHNESTGLINLTTFGDNPFSYSWSNGEITEDISGLDSGMYVLTTTDGNGCSRTDTFELTNPSEITSTTITDTLSCIGLCDGEAIVIPSDGVIPYTFEWNNDSTQINDTANNLCYGTNTVTISDVNGCLHTNEVFIENPDTLQLSNITIDSACYQICDGQLSVTIEGGESPYTTEWSITGNIFNTTDTITNNDLCSGDYQLIYTDANSCSDTVLIPLIERDSFLVQDWVIDDSCYNSCTGQIKVQLLNPVNSPIIYSWDNGAMDTVISNLCSDTFELIVIDSRLCGDTFELFVAPGDSMYFDSVAVTHNSCYGDTSGVISINSNGGVLPLDYEWSNSDSTSGINSLASGFYTVIVTDANGCIIDSSNIEVSQPDLLFVTPSLENVSCFGALDGLIDIDIFGGVEPYFISWDNLIADSTLIDTLPAGEYIYTIVDDSLCILSDTLIIEEPTELVMSDSIVDVLCKGDATGEIHLEVEGGVSPYQYSIDNGTNFQSQAYFDNLSAASYSIIVKDANDCEITSNLLDVSEPLTVLSAGLTPPNLLCFGDTGTVVLSVGGGTPNYSFLWGNGENSQNLNDVVAGNYSVTIFDANDCEIQEMINIFSPDEIESNPSPIVTDVDCFGNTTGSINVTIVGGETPYDYLWSDGSPTSSITNLTSGTYDLIVIDDNNCKYEESIIVNEPDLLEATYIATNVACFGESNGEIDITVTGGTSSYTYAWSNLTIDEDLLNILAGTYTVTVTDVNNCSTSLSVTINEPSEIFYSVSTIDLLCEGEDEGQISISSIAGGTPAYEYSIDGYTYQPSTVPFNNLSTGNYAVNIRDQNGCSKDTLVVLDEPIGFSTIVNVQNIDEAGSCNGDASGSISFSISGNTSPYTYSWSNGESTSSIFNLTAGTYNLDLYDANNCSMIYSYLITEPDAISLDYSVTPTSCEEKNDGSITTFVTGGTSPITYDWGTGEATSDIYNLAKGTYSLLIEDANGCSLPLEFIEVNFDGYNGCIEIPSGFTPNNDNVHDEWVIYGLSDFPDVLVKVYNRWGQELFSSSGYDFPWDGKHNGVDLPTATYYYVIELNESNKVFNGTVTIKR